MQLPPTPALSFESGKISNDGATYHQHFEWREYDLDEYFQQDLWFSYDQSRTGKITATLYSAADYSLVMLVRRQGSIDDFSNTVAFCNKAQYADNGHSPYQIL